MKKLILTITLTLLTSASFAANSGPNEVRDKMQDKCGADIAKYCAKVKTGNDMQACFAENSDKFSQGCTEFLTKLKILIQKPSK